MVEVGVGHWSKEESFQYSFRYSRTVSTADRKVPRKERKKSLHMCDTVGDGGGNLPMLGKGDRKRAKEITMRNRV